MRNEQFGFPLKQNEMAALEARVRGFVRLE
jgi:hypothetical protein